MKTLLCIAGITGFALFSSCTSEAPKAEATTAELTEITPFVVNKVYLRDTAYDAHMMEYKTQEAYDAEFGGQHFRPDGSAFENLGDYMRSIRKDSSVLMYRDIKGKPLTEAEKTELFTLCDSITETYIDKQGVEHTSDPMFVCDSSSRYYFNDMVQFYESWYVNKKTRMLERQQLGFSTWEWMYDKHGYRHLYTVFTDEASRQKVLKYLKD